MTTQMNYPQAVYFTVQEAHEKMNMNLYVHERDGYRLASVQPVVGSNGETQGFWLFYSKHKAE